MHTEQGCRGCLPANLIGLPSALEAAGDRPQSLRLIATVDLRIPSVVTLLRRSGQGRLGRHRWVVRPQRERPHEALSSCPVFGGGVLSRTSPVLTWGDYSELSVARLRMGARSSTVTLGRACQRRGMLGDCLFQQFHVERPGRRAASVLATGSATYTSAAARVHSV